MANTVQDRIQNLRNYRESQITQALKEQAEKENKKNELGQEIRNLQQRITDLIEVANACLSNGVRLDIRDCHGSNTIDTFIAESIHHGLGFCNEAEYSANAKSHVKFIGFNGGGFCGEWHFRTDGNTIVEYAHVYDTDMPKRRDFKDIPVEHLKSFVRRFDDFETRFLEYVDTFQA